MKTTSDLAEALLANDLKKMKRLMWEKLAKKRDRKGGTLLHTAVWRKTDGKVVRFLLRHGADVNARDKDGWTPLHTAAVNDVDNVVRILLDHGADPSILTNKSNMTALELASFEKAHRVERLLRSHERKKP